MRYKVIYENNRGQRVNLSERPYFLDIEPILDYQWSYSEKEKRRGNIIAGFAKDIQSVDLTLHIMDANAEARDEAVDYFNNVIEADIYDGIAGRLLIGDWYTWGYIIASKNTKWQYGNPVVKKVVKLVREQENWYHVVQKANYGSAQAEELYNFVEEDIKTYELEPISVYDSEVNEGYDYEYEYMADTQSQKRINNPNSVPCDFSITIQGYVDRPEVQIGDNVIAFDLEVPYGAFLTVDSSKKTAIMTLADGEQVNVFGARDPDYYLFEKIKEGKNTVTWNGSFLWEIKMLEERSEPRWLMD